MSLSQPVANRVTNSSREDKQKKINVFFRTSIFEGMELCIRVYLSLGITISMVQSSMIVKRASPRKTK